MFSGSPPVVCFSVLQIRLQRTLLCESAVAMLPM